MYIYGFRVLYFDLLLIDCLRYDVPVGGMTYKVVTSQIGCAAAVNVAVCKLVYSTDF